MDSVLNSKDSEKSLTLSDLDKSQYSVFRVVERYGPMTRKEIAMQMAVDQCCITGRIDELTRGKMPLIKKCEYKKKNPSGAMAEVFAINNGELFHVATKGRYSNDN